MNKKSVILLGSLLVFIVIGFTMTRSDGSVSSSAAKENIRQNKYDVIVDVRTREEWQKGHRPDSISIPIGVFVTDFPKIVPDKKKRILFVCKKGIRSSAAALMANKKGYHHVEYVEGDHDGLVD